MNETFRIVALVAEQFGILVSLSTLQYSSGVQCVQCVQLTEFDKSDLGDLGDLGLGRKDWCRGLHGVFRFDIPQVAHSKWPPSTFPKFPKRPGWGSSVVTLSAWRGRHKSVPAGSESSAHMHTRHTRHTRHSLCGPKGNG